MYHIRIHVFLPIRKYKNTKAACANLTLSMFYFI